MARKVGVLYLALWSVLGTVVGLGEQETVLPGLLYEHRTMDGPLSIHLLEIEPRKIEIYAGRAFNDGIGLETVSSIASRNAAVAAVNGGFFGKGGRYHGDPTGVLKIAGKWFSGSRIPRGLIGWTGKGERAVIGRATTAWSLVVNGEEFPVSGINKSRRAREAILYTWAFHRSTLTSPGGTEVLVQDGRIREILKSGDSPIPMEGFVYSLGPEADVSAIEEWAPGVQARSQVGFVPEEGFEQPWQEMDYILGGTPVLISGGRLLDDFSPEKVSQSFIETRHPRTAVGVLADGRWVVLVVDGRRPNLSVGMTLKELGEFLLSLGCVDALNLDGGGSSTMVVQGKVMNSPSDINGERAVSDAVLFRAK